MDAIDVLLTRGVDKIYPSREALEKVLRSGKKLKLYQGFDPTGAQLHIGHAVAIRKLRQFQELGHTVIFLIGDFTARIGDPTGKLDSRQMLSKEEVLQNAQHYKVQAAKVLRFDKPNPVVVKYNSEWLGTMSALEFLQLAHHLSYQQVVERDMFQGRMKQGQDIYVNEFLYPIMQAYDSVAMDVDLELGGTDQMFNMLMGRKLMRNMKRKEKFVMTVPLLTDAKGTKIGKTEGNVIGLTDTPNDFFGKIMALGDDVIVPGFRLLTDTPDEEIDAMQQQMKQGNNPMTFKKQLAFALTKQFNTTQAAQAAQAEFEQVHQQGERPEEAPEFSTSQTEWNPVDLLVASGLASSKSEAKRLVEQGAVEINSVKCQVSGVRLNNNDIIKVGKKKFLKILRR